MNYFYQSIFKRNCFFFTILFFSFINLYSQPIVNCNCPEEGKYEIGSVLLDNKIVGDFSDQDLRKDMHNYYWDFGNVDKKPDVGLHYYDYYRVQVSITGDYSFRGTDSNKLIIGIFKRNDFSDIVGGVGGYVGDSLSLYFEEPQNDGKVNNTFSLTAEVDYFFVFTDFDTKYKGEYEVFIDVPDGAEIKFLKKVYDSECEFYGCYNEDNHYDFPLPTLNNGVIDTITWTESVVDEPVCGSSAIQRIYTIKDTSDNIFTCTSEYLVNGYRLDNVEWPLNWIGEEGQNPVLGCDYPKDAKGNPHPDFTGAPIGFNNTCGTIEVFYLDRIYGLDDGLEYGTKILRTWTLVDDCTGNIITHIQAIVIKDKWLPRFKETDTLFIKTGPYKCEIDKYVTELLDSVIVKNKDLKQWISISGGNVVGDKNSNGYIDEDEDWKVTNLTSGKYKFCYHVIDTCNVEWEKCMNINVYDGVRPVSVCQQNIVLKVSETEKIYAKSFDNGSFDNCNPVYFKVLRVNDDLEYDGGCFDENINNDSINDEKEVWYDDEVYFCCEDIGKQIMVTLRVFDVYPGNGPINPTQMIENGELYGRFNDCWSIVTIESNDSLSIECPAVSVLCDESLDPESNPNINIIVNSICDPELSYIDYREESCSKEIKRTWTARVGNKKVTCDQIITLPDSLENFDPCTVILPEDKFYDCAADYRIDIPTWEENNCNIVTATFHDDTFTFVDGACIKIVRNWVIIDWCVYEPSPNFPNDDKVIGNKFDCDELIRDGEYKYTQILQFTDHTSPLLFADDECLGSDDCYAKDMIFTATAEDSCSINQEFFWKYIVTNMDTWETVQYSYNYLPTPLTGIVGKRTKDKLDKTNEAKIVMREDMPIGNYRISWTVGDGCGNATTLHQKITIADKKPPTPIMVDIASVVMTDDKAELIARTFDKGGCDYGCISSVDNCTSKDNLLFTFSDKLPHLFNNDSDKWLEQFIEFGKYFFDPNTGEISDEDAYLEGLADAWLPQSRSSQRVYFCPDDVLLSKIIKIYVFDRFDDSTDKCDDGNFAFSKVKLLFSNCSGFDSATVEGTVKTVGDDLFTGMVMKAASDIDTTFTTSENGDYKFELTNGNYWISGSNDEDYLNGVTTRDLLLMTYHLYHFDTWDDSLQMIASCVNNGFPATTLDITIFNNMLLRKSKSLNTHSWVAVPKKFSFSDRLSLFGICDNYIKTKDIRLDGVPIKDVDFVAIKIGDLDFSANRALKIRDDRDVTFVAENKELIKNEIVDIPIYAKNFSDIKGLQITLNFEGLEIIKINPGYIGATLNSTNIIENDLILNWINNYEGIEDGDLLFTLRVKPKVEGKKVEDILSFNDKHFRTEAYYGQDYEITKIDLEFKASVSTIETYTGFKLYQNQPNPFSNITTIGFEMTDVSPYKLTIFEMTGKELYTIKGISKAGLNKVDIDLSDIKTKGLFMYKLESDNNVAIKKMIKL